MTEQPKKPSWETLAQELGAASTSPPVRPRVETPKPVAPPAAIGTPAPPPATPEAPKKRGWDDLASWLGLGGGKRTRPEAAPAAPQPLPPVVPLMPPAEPRAVEPRAVEPRAAEPPREELRHEPRRDRRDDRRDRQRPERHEPRREEETASSFAPPPIDEVEDDLSIDRPEGRHAAEPSGGETGDQPRRRRRRRRRGGRGRNRDEAAGQAPRSREPQGTVDDLGDAEFVREVDDRDLDDRGRDDAGDGASANDRNGAERGDAGESRRPRRRRRRGRGGRDRDRDRGPAESRPPRMEAEPPIEDDDVLDVDEESITRERIRAEGIADELDDAHDDEGGEDAHLMHRGIPTWEEAIGMIVNVNLEARAKHPHSSSGHHHRGGGRGRGRGGRDRGGR